MATKTKPIGLLVTTEHRGVFFGYGEPKAEGGEIRLVNARMCVYWTQAMKGVLGLAVKGPDASCKVGFAVPAITLKDVTSVAECSEEAVKAWEAAPWR